MSNSGRKTPRLVADKRTPKSKKKKPAPKRRKAPARRKRTPSRNPVIRLVRGLLGWIFRIVWGIGWRVTAVVALIVGVAVGYTYTTLPPVNELLDGRARGSVTLLDREGDVFAWRGDTFGGVFTSDTVSEHLKNAVIATEDKRFNMHLGISPRGIASAIRINLSEGRGPLSGHGGSTLTQQTAKLICLGVPFDADVWKNEREYEADCRETSLWRKAKEAVYSMAMEAKYTKDEILTV